MAQVCIDSKVFTDMRFKALARNLKISVDDAIGKCLRVWHCCMQLEKSELTDDMIDDCVDIPGFHRQMLSVGLARFANTEARSIYIAGTRGRLEKKSEILALTPKPRAIKKVDPPSGVNEIVALYHDEFFKLYRIKWKPDGKSLGIAKGMVKDFGLDVTKKLVSAYFQIRRQDFTRKHHDWGTFKLNLNVVQVQSGIGRVIGTDESKTIERTNQNLSAAQRYLEKVGQEGVNNEAC
jgi:hypothetical protein